MIAQRTQGGFHVFTPPTDAEATLDTVAQFARTAMIELCNRATPKRVVESLRHPMVAVVYNNMRPVGMYAYSFGGPNVRHGYNRLVTCLFRKEGPMRTERGALTIWSDVTYGWDQGWLAIVGHYPSGVNHEHTYVYMAGEYHNCDDINHNHYDVPVKHR
jgi:hypothetical protein